MKGINLCSLCASLNSQLMDFYGFIILRCDLLIFYYCLYYNFKELLFKILLMNFNGLITLRIFFTVLFMECNGVITFKMLIIKLLF